LTETKHYEHDVSETDVVTLNLRVIGLPQDMAAYCTEGK